MGTNPSTLRLEPRSTHSLTPPRRPRSHHAVCNYRVLRDMAARTKHCPVCQASVPRTWDVVRDDALRTEFTPCRRAPRKRTHAATKYLPRCRHGYYAQWEPAEQDLEGWPRKQRCVTPNGVTHRVVTTDMNSKSSPGDDWWQKKCLRLQYANVSFPRGHT